MADCSRIVLPLPQDEQVYVSDPKALYHIVLKDQDVFEETEYFTKSNFVCFGAGMVSVVGEQHRKQRKMMNPVFNINHIRSLTPIFYRITNDVRISVQAVLRLLSFPFRKGVCNEHIALTRRNFV